MSVLFALLKADAQPDWYLAHSAHDIEQLELSELDRVRADRVALIVPGMDVFLAEITASTRSMSDLRTAALFQLEDDLSQSVSSLHIAIADRSGDKSTARRVAVVDRVHMPVWMELGDSLPDMLREKVEFIPVTSLFADVSPFLYDGDGHVVLAAGHTAFEVDPALATDIVPALAQQMELTDVRRIEGASPVLSSIALSETSTIDETSVSFDSLLAGPLLSGKGLDLRQGEFARRSSAAFNVRGWGISMGLAAAACLVWFISLGFSTMGLNRASDALYDDMVDAYARSFPSQGRVVDPVREVSQRLNGQTNTLTGPTFIQLSSAFYEGLEEVEGVSVQGLSYDGQNGQLTATLLFSSYQDRDELVQIFSARGINLQLGGARQESGLIIGEASIGGRS